MTQPLHLSDQAWKDAESLVQRLESAARERTSPESFYEELVNGLRFVCGAALTTLFCHDEGSTRALARSGIALHRGSDPSRTADSPVDDIGNSHSIDSSPESHSHCVTTQAEVHEQVQLQLEIRFHQPVSITTREHLSDLADVVLSFASTVYLRQRFAELRRELKSQSDRDQWVSHLNAGVTLQQSFSAIASAVDPETSADRVSLIRITKSHSRLIATSTQSSVDHRGTVARSLQQIATLARSLDELNWSSSEAFDANPELRDSIELHAKATGCRHLYVKLIRNTDGDPIAAIGLEWFRPLTELPSPASEWSSIADPVETAIAGAITRDESHLAGLVGRWMLAPARLTTVLLLIVLAGCFLTLMPATLRVPAEGKLVANERARLFAPCEGIVVDVLVDHGQKVKRGQPLLRLTSPTLEQARAEIEGRIATARTQLDARLATRSSSGVSDNSRRTPSSAADERILQSEIDGLEQQLALIEQQERELIVTSPLDGEVDAWNLTQGWSGRPVARGQFLLDVFDPDRAFHVELQLPDRMSGYIVHDSEPSTDRPVAFRLRSDPTVTYWGLVRDVAATAQVNERGESTIRIRVDFTERPATPLRHGATVVAKISGPQRPIGFVWIERLIQWSRETIWF